MKIGAMSMQKTNRSFRQIRKRLNNLCKGLLEVRYVSAGDSEDALPSSVLFNWKVDFLHRTVRDFLITPDTQRLLKKWGQESFDANASICQALLAQIKTVPPEYEYFLPSGPTQRLFQAFMHHAKVLDEMDDLRSLQISLLDDLEITIRHFDDVICGQTHRSMWICPRQESNYNRAQFLEECVSAGLFEYIMHRTSGPDAKSPTDTLPTALKAFDSSLVHALLEKGADPNGPSASGTIWIDFLRLLYEGDKIGQIEEKAKIMTERSYLIVEEMLAHGAAIDIKVLDGDKRLLTVEEMVSDALEASQMSLLQRYFDGAPQEQKSECWTLQQDPEARQRSRVRSSIKKYLQGLGRSGTK